jgi:hypothetical protein
LGSDPRHVRLHRPRSRYDIDVHKNHIKDDSVADLTITAVIASRKRRSGAALASAPPHEFIAEKRHPNRARAKSKGYLGYLWKIAEPAHNGIVTRFGILLALICLVGLSSIAQAKQLAVIANTANSTSNLAAGDLIKILNGQKRNWPDNSPVLVVIRDASNADTQLLLRKLLDLTPEQAQAFVQNHREIIKTVDSEDAILRLVSTLHGAIGVLDLYHITRDVNVVKIDGKLPVEPGYLLKENIP